MDGIFPELITTKINFYIWKEKISETNSKYHEVFTDRFDDGRVWISHKHLSQEWINEEERALLVFNHRGVKGNMISINKIKEKDDGKFVVINHDYWIISDDKVREVVVWPLPKNY